MIEQFKKIKEQYPDMVLLFRCGDIYECYYEDAKVLNDVLGITPTNRGDIPVSGFHFHALDEYLPMLVRNGKRVAICDKIEQPKEKKILPECDITKGDVIYDAKSIINDLRRKYKEQGTFIMKVLLEDKYIARKFYSFVRASNNSVWLYHDVVAIKFYKNTVLSKETLDVLDEYLGVYLKNVKQIVIE